MIWIESNDAEIIFAKRSLNWNKKFIKLIKFMNKDD